VRRPLVAVLAVGLVASCSSGGDDDDRTPPAPPPAAAPGAIEERECPDADQLPDTAVCSWVVVPENRDEPDGAEVRLAVVELYSTAPEPPNDVVVYLHGGPGGDATGSTSNWADDPILETRNVVLFDQRGSGLSEPALDCPEVDADILARFTAAGSYDDERASRADAWAACRERLVADGIDLDAYDSEAIADDLESLRLILGVEQWNLFGVSYGTRIALTYMREYPEHVRTALLDSVVAPAVGGVSYFVENGNSGIEQLVEGCLADTACAAAYPDFATAVDRAYEQLNAEPFTGEVDLGGEAGVVTVVVDGSDALAGLFAALYDYELIPLLPTVVEAIAAGDYSALPAIAQEGIAEATGFSDGATISVLCADSMPTFAEEDDAIIGAPGRNASLVIEVFDAYCDLWDVEPVGDGFHDPVTVDVPTMVVAGRYDPITPPAGGEAVAAALPNAGYAEWDGMSHGVLFSDAPCSEQQWLTWLADPTVPPDLACAADAVPPAFVAG